MCIRDRSDNYIKAGLALAREKWERGIYLSGSDAFREKATALAAEMGIIIRGGALQRQIPDIGELSHRYGKPICSGKLAAGRQHTGRLLLASVESADEGMVVIDGGRELVVIRTDEKTTAALQHEIGTLVRAHAGNDHPGGGAALKLAWRISELERKGPEQGISLGS